MIRGKPQFAPWIEDPDPADYWGEAEFAEFRKRVREYFGRPVEDASGSVTMTPTPSDPVQHMSGVRHTTMIAIALGRGKR